MKAGFRKCSLLSSQGAPGLSTTSQMLKEARCRQDNHHLIRGYIESRLTLMRYKLKRSVHQHAHMYTAVVEHTCTHIVRAGVIMVHDDTLQKEAITLSLYTCGQACVQKTTHTHKHTDTHTISCFPLSDFSPLPPS